MVNVGILSMQRIYNYGSFLQSFALKRILEDLGADVQFVDYHPGRPLEGDKEKVGFVRKLSRAMDSFKLDTDVKNKLAYIQYKKNYGKKYFPYLGLPDTMNYQPKVDLLVVGSDEVFNCVQDNVNVGYSPDLFGQNNHAKRLISYAASFGNTTVDKLMQHHIYEEVAGWLRSFDSLSVRDSNSNDVVTKLVGSSPVKNIDPVLAFDYVNRLEKIPDVIPIKEKYLLLYGYTGRFSRQECNEIRKLANKRNLKVICLGGLQHCCDKFIDCSPFEVITYFQNAEAVITDTFHGTILSVITHRQFATLIRESGYGNTQKLNDLLCTLNLTEQITPVIGQVQNQLENSIQYDDVDKIITNERIKTYDYLKKQIDCIKM